MFFFERQFLAVMVTFFTKKEWRGTRIANEYQSLGRFYYSIQYLQDELVSICRPARTALLTRKSYLRVKVKLT